MAAQHYTVTSFEKSNFQDRNNNYWCTVVFEGVGEPVTWVMRAETVPKVAVGSIWYGEIRDYTSSKGKQMQRFYKGQEPEEHHSESAAPVKKEWLPESPERQNSINRSVALNNAATVFQGTGAEAHLITGWADAFYSWLTSPIPQAKIVDGMTSEEIASLAQKDEVHDVDDNEPINLNDIPF